MKALLCALLLVPVPLMEAEAPGPDTLTLWRVTKGEWVTWRRPNLCDHFSMGGSRSDLKIILAHCRGRRNRLWLPTTTPEHLRAVRAFLREADLCLAERPEPRERRRIPQALEPCAEPPDRDVRSFRLPRRTSPRRRDYPRRIYWLPDAQVLILGDAKHDEIAAEKRAWQNTPPKIVILAQHGRAGGISSAALEPAGSPFRQLLVSDFEAPKRATKANLVRSRVDPKTRRTAARAGLTILKTSERGHIHVEL